MHQPVCCYQCAPVNAELVRQASLMTLMHGFSSATTTGIMTGTRNQRRLTAVVYIGQRLPIPLVAAVRFGARVCVGFVCRERNHILSDVKSTTRLVDLIEVFTKFFLVSPSPRSLFHSSLAARAGHRLKSSRHCHDIDIAMRHNSCMCKV